MTLVPEMLAALPDPVAPAQAARSRWPGLTLRRLLRAAAVTKRRLLFTGARVSRLLRS